MGEGEESAYFKFRSIRVVLIPRGAYSKGEAQIPGFPVSINFKNKTHIQTNKASLCTLSLIIFRCPLQIPS